MGRIKNALRVLLGKQPKKEIYAVPHMIRENELLKGKNAIIIGGSGGIGASIAENFVKNGCKVIITGTKNEKLNNIIDNIHSKYGKEVFIKKYLLNLNDLDKLEEKILDCIGVFPNKIVDILVNAAGLNSTNSFWNYSFDDFNKIINCNLRGAFFVSQIISKYMIHHNTKGHILNISSSSALRPAKTAYEISKWGIAGFTKGLADLCLPYGIIVNAIAPGPVMTEMLGKKETDDIYSDFTISGRYALPNEISELAVFMVSDFGNLIVGDTYYITGGSGVISYHH